MKKLIVLTIIFIAQWGGPCFSQENGNTNPHEIYVIGSGFKSCAHWTPQYDISIQGWIAGFWSGINNFNTHHTVGVNAEYEGIIEEVRLECRNNPSESIEEATIKTYNLLLSKNR